MKDLKLGNFSGWIWIVCMVILYPAMIFVDTADYEWEKVFFMWLVIGFLLMFSLSLVETIIKGLLSIFGINFKNDKKEKKN